ncbi:MAG: TetR/AcrR family transcriptional regulator; helix-turn-helix transcriptional regulator [Saprospiraceae bacterium]|jgi:AcrR family transcriptional regulator|nr:TetR/AcrR family transcriptional regulator; helix-turn-helix transcriptional regulator [Saprospiraceae bacterium]
MKLVKKKEKEVNIILAAESVFGKVGFKNAKMEDIAREAGITKVTLYSYFQSKENLYLAVTYKALLLLIEDYSSCIERNAKNPGIEASIDLLETFMAFSERNHLYSETLMEYFSLMRATSAGQDQAWLTEAVIQSMYYDKLQEIQNLPFKLIVKEIERGKVDGSIISELNPMMATLMGWSMVLGYMKLLSASGKNVSHLFHVSLNEMKEVNLRLARHLFQTKQL